MSSSIDVAATGGKVKSVTNGQNPDSSTGSIKDSSGNEVATWDATNGTTVSGFTTIQDNDAIYYCFAADNPSFATQISDAAFTC